MTSTEIPPAPIEILVAEDDPLSRETLVELLERRGFEVVRREVGHVKTPDFWRDESYLGFLERSLKYIFEQTLKNW